MSASEVLQNEEKSVQIKTESQRRGSDDTRGAGKEEKTADTAGNKAFCFTLGPWFPAPVGCFPMKRQCLLEPLFLSDKHYIKAHMSS